MGGCATRRSTSPARLPRAVALASAALLFTIGFLGLACTSGLPGRASTRTSPLERPPFKAGAPGESARPNPRNAPGAPTRVAPWLPTEVRVRLGFAQGARSLEIGGTSSGTLSIGARKSQGQAAALLVNGIPMEAPLRLRAAPDLAGIELAGRTYPGSMIIEALPSGGLAAVNVVDLEAYVQGVVAAELVLWSAKPAELEAQSIATRTYAARRLAPAAGGRLELADGTSDQAYRGLFMPAASAGSQKVAARLARAVGRTRGQVLVKGTALLDARFHASCGGRTAAFGDIFDEGGPGTGGITCEPCAARARREHSFGEVDSRGPLAWQHRVESAQLSALARQVGIGSRLLRVRPARMDAGGRWLEVELEGDGGLFKLPFRSLRAKLGNTSLKSAQLSRLKPAPGQTVEGNLVFEGLGRGHGVGLCQEGCRDYASQGWSAARILAHYYPGAVIERLPD